MMPRASQEQTRKLLAAFRERFYVVQGESPPTFPAEKLRELAVAFARKIPPCGFVVQALFHFATRRKYCKS
jgi:hypothetical protein